MTRDSGRSAVYEAEHQVSRLLDRGGHVDFFGSRLDVRRQRRFGDIEGVRSYLAAARGLDWGCPEVPMPEIRPRRGTRKAEWREPGVITLPAQEGWAMREMVVLHEYAHHVEYHSSRNLMHDRRFCGTLIDLLSGALGPEAGLLLTASYAESGVLRASGDPQPYPARL